MSRFPYLQALLSRSDEEIDSWMEGFIQFGVTLSDMGIYVGYGRRPQSVVLKEIYDHLVSSEQSSDNADRFRASLTRVVDNLTATVSTKPRTGYIYELLHIISDFDLINHCFDNLARLALDGCLEGNSADSHALTLMVILDAKVDRATEPKRFETLLEIASKWISDPRYTHYAFRLGWQNDRSVGWSLAPRFLVTATQNEKISIGECFNDFFENEPASQILARFSQLLSDLAIQIAKVPPGNKIS